MVVSHFFNASLDRRILPLDLPLPARQYRRTLHHERRLPYGNATQTIAVLSIHKRILGIIGLLILEKASAKNIDG